MLSYSRGRFICMQHNHKRTFLFATSLAVGGLIFGRQAQLADAMSRGELHNKNKDYKVLKEQEVDRSLEKLRNSRPMAPSYSGHIPLYTHEKVLLSLVAGIKSYFYPQNGTNIVQLGEATAHPYYLEQLKKTMLADKTGRRILKERPQISEVDLKMDKLAKYSPNSLGYSFYMWLRSEGVTPDTRAPVRYIDDPVYAYIFQRYRQCHDFYHAINNLPIIIEGEIAVKALEATNIGIPMAALGMLLAPIGLKSSRKEILYNIYLPWAIETGLTCKPLINVYWEEMLHMDIDEVRKQLRIQKPPNLRRMIREKIEMRKQFKLKYGT